MAVVGCKGMLGRMWDTMGRGIGMDRGNSGKYRAAGLKA